MPETFEIPLDIVDDWASKETSSIVKPLRAEAKKILDDTKDKLEELLDACDNLLEDAEKEMAKGSRKTYRRAKCLFKLAGTFSDSIEQITFPEEINGKTLNETLEQLKKTMYSISQEKTKWFRAISPYFIISRRRFDVSYKRADDSFQSLANFLSNDYAKAESAEGITSKVNDLRQSLAELNKTKKAKKSRKKKKENLDKKIKQTKQKLQALQNKEELVELAQLNTKIEELTKKVKRELRHLEKPFLKFQTLVINPGYSLLPDSKNKLEEYLENPFEALATEKIGYPLLKRILQKIKTAIDNNKLKLKSSRLRKAKDQTYRIVEKDALMSLQRDSIDAFHKKNDLESSRTMKEYRNESPKLLDRLKNLELHKSSLEIRDKIFERKRKEAQDRVYNQKLLLEKIVSELSNKNIQILIE